MTTELELYQIALRRPKGVTVAELKAYIKDAVENWGGQKHPEDPLFYPWGEGNFQLPEIQVRKVYP